MVDLLKADFVAKSDEVFMWAFLIGMYGMLPGISSFWPMSGVSKDDYVYFSNNGFYDMINEIMISGGTLQGSFAQPWNPGGYVAGAPAATGYVNVNINGTTYKLLTST